MSSPGQNRAPAGAAFLSQASAALADSLDLDTTLQTVANLAVPGIADSCAIHLIDEHGVIRLAAAMHVDPLKAAAMQALADPEAGGPSRAWFRTIRDGTPALLADISEDDIRESLQADDRLLRVYDEVRFHSQISVPLRVRGRTIGGITLMLGPGSRRYDVADLALAEDLAGRAAMAVENARLYKQANEANRLKDEFLGTLSHELRTPLNAILGYARMLRGGIFADPAKQARALEILERNANVLTQIVEDVLDVSRIIAGKLRLNVQEIPLAPVVNDAVATILPAADAKGVKVLAVCDRVSLSVVGDAERLQQVIWNLLANAVKFTSSGGTVRVELDQRESHAVVTVRDSGCGIDTDFLPHLFERFRQADSRFSRQHGGLGLGLAIAREIVETHGGTIQAESAGAGQGATFTMRLPSVAAASAGAPIAGAGAEPPLPILGRLAGIRVLVVDDDDDARAMVQSIVEEAGGHAETVGSAADALQRLDEAPVDIIVADLGMPSMDGLQLIEEIRRRPDRARLIPALALTAYARSEDRITAMSRGFQRHLPKPVDHMLLVAAICALVQHRAELL
jgi:signal transduction histidine kinase/ActR/RegA family two-component response regulator